MSTGPIPKYKVGSHQPAEGLIIDRSGHRGEIEHFIVDKNGVKHKLPPPEIKFSRREKEESVTGLTINDFKITDQDNRIRNSEFYINKDGELQQKAPN